MGQQRERLNLDLDFLDKESESSKEKKKQAKRQGKQRSKGNSSVKDWKSKGLIIGFILLVCWAWFSEEESSINQKSNGKINANPSHDSIEYSVGNYYCSEYHSKKAEELLPDQNTQKNLEFELSALNEEEIRLENLYDTINSSTVNEYSSQSSIDYYNDLVDNYNVRRENYNSKVVDLNQRFEHHSKKVDIYNNYLDQNCSKK